MNKQLRDEVRKHEEALERLSVKTHTFEARRNKLLDRSYVALNSQTVRMLQSFLSLSQTLEDAYAVILGPWWRRRMSEPSVNDLFQEKSKGIGQKVKDVHNLLAKLASSADDALASLLALEFDIKEHYDAKILPLQRCVETTRKGLEADISHVVKRLEKGKAQADTLRTRLQELESENEALEKAINTSSKKAKDAAETGFCSFAFALICILVGLAFPPLLIFGIVLLMNGLAHGGLSLVASNRSIALKKDINIIQQEIKSEQASISIIQYEMLELGTIQKDLRALIDRISGLSSKAEGLCKSSREIERLFVADKASSTSNLIAAKKLADMFQTMKFRSTQQEVLKLMKTVANNVMGSAQHGYLLLRATRPERSRLQRMSGMLESSLKKIERKCPAIAELLGDDFDEELFQETKEIDGCGIHEPLLAVILGWSFYLTHRAIILFSTAIYTTIVQYKSFFIYSIGGLVLILAISTRVMIEQVFVIEIVLFIWWKLSLLERKADKGVVIIKVE